MDPAVAWFQDEQKGPSQVTWENIWGTMQEIEHNKETANSIEQSGSAAGTGAANPKTAKEMNMLLDRNSNSASSDSSSVPVVSARTPLATREATSNTGNHHHNNSTGATDRSSAPANNTNNTNSNNTGERTYYNPSRRKGASQLDTNRASTYNMNRHHQRLVGKHGGCPWRPADYVYGRGVLG